MTLGKKLAFSYLLLLGFIGLIVGMSVLRLDGLTRMAREVVEGDAVRAELASQINLHAESAAGRLALLFVLDDRDLRARTYQEIDQHNSGIDRAIEQLKPLFADASQASGLQRLVTLRQAFEKEFTATVEEIEGNERASAAKRMAGATRDSLKALLQETEAMARQQQQAMAQRQEASAQLAGSARWLMFVLGLGALLAGLWMAVRITRDITRALAMGVSVANAVAGGDLTRTFDVVGKDELAALGMALNTMQDGLSRVVNEVRQAAESVSTTSSEIAEANQNLSARTENQASALQETASSMEELSSMVQKNAEHARLANELSMSAADVAVRGGAVVGQVVETMHDINDSSRKIIDIISVIDGISFQTNILALNAAVEAARAGEQGRGFAVVASEVRALAKRSASAAREIAAIIQTSVEKVEKGTNLANAAGSTMAEVVAGIQRVTDIMGEISIASNEQSLGVAQVGEAVTDMDLTTQQNAALVEHMAAAATGLQGKSRDLVHLVASFRLAPEDAPSLRVAVPTFQLSTIGPAL